jgi:hypothetical protein
LDTEGRTSSFNFFGVIEIEKMIKKLFMTGSDFYFVNLQFTTKSLDSLFSIAQKREKVNGKK